MQFTDYVFTIRRMKYIIQQHSSYNNCKLSF